DVGAEDPPVDVACPVRLAGGLVGEVVHPAHANLGRGRVRDEEKADGNAGVRPVVEGVACAIGEVGPEVPDVRRPLDPDGYRIVPAIDPPRNVAPPCREDLVNVGQVAATGDFALDGCVILRRRRREVGAAYADEVALLRTELDLSWRRVGGSAARPGPGRARGLHRDESAERDDGDKEQEFAAFHRPRSGASRNPVTISKNVRGCSQNGMWPAPAMTSRRARGMTAAVSRATSGG